MPQMKRNIDCCATSPTGVMMFAISLGLIALYHAELVSATSVTTPTIGRVTRDRSASCQNDLDCSLNGDCHFGSCVCDKGWTGKECSKLKFKKLGDGSSSKTPSHDGGVYPTSDYNTWSGPLLYDNATSLYHLYVPLYVNGSLTKTIDMLHGTATAESPTTNYSWESMGFNDGTNPALIVYPSNDGGDLVYSLWIGGKIRTSSSPDGPFQLLPNATLPNSGNPSPVYHNGSFYMTSQHTTTIWTSDSITGPWSVYSTIDVNIPNGTKLEDPNLWIDPIRGGWHIINHAYDLSEFYNCSKSVVSAHLYSRDGIDWFISDEEPYGHVVDYVDGSSHVFCTLERPYLQRNATNGRPEHLVLAADLVTGEEGCATKVDGTTATILLPLSRTTTALKHPCVNCKWHDLAGTIVLAVDTD